MAKKSTETKQPAPKSAPKPKSAGKTLKQLQDQYKGQPMIPIDHVDMGRKGK